MSTLLLLRHAKSSWDDVSVPDHDRPLAPRGITAARRIADHLRAEDLAPELVLCSSARRTCETLALLEPSLDHATVEIEDNLYGAGEAELLDRLHRIDAEVDSVMVIAHNPGLQDLAIALAGSGDAAAMQQLHTKFPTAALAALDIGPAGWHALAAGDASLTTFVLPRRLG